jgi:hypothetical protein
VSHGTSNQGRLTERMLKKKHAIDMTHGQARGFKAIASE